MFIYYIYIERERIVKIKSKKSKKEKILKVYLKKKFFTFKNTKVRNYVF